MNSELKVSKNAEVVVMRWMSTTRGARHHVVRVESVARLTPSGLIVTDDGAQWNSDGSARARGCHDHIEPRGPEHQVDIDHLVAERGVRDGLTSLSRVGDDMPHPNYRRALEYAPAADLAKLREHLAAARDLLHGMMHPTGGFK